MSADIWLERNGEQLILDPSLDAEFRSLVPTRSPLGLDPTTVNLTYNLSPMLRAAGMPAWAEMIGLPAAEAGIIWTRVAENMRVLPNLYKSMNPKNGWGTYENALAALDVLVAACNLYPDATVSGWL